MIEDLDVSSQIHDCYLLISDLSNEDIKLSKPFVTGYLIETLPNSWKDYKNNLKHKKIVCRRCNFIYIWIEE